MEAVKDLDNRTPGLGTTEAESTGQNWSGIAGSGFIHIAHRSLQNLDISSVLEYHIKTSEFRTRDQRPTIARKF